MTTVFVTNQPTKSCCGKPKGECSCSPPANNQEPTRPAFIENYDYWQQAFEPEPSEPATNISSDKPEPIPDVQWNWGD